MTHPIAPLRNGSRASHPRLGRRTSLGLALMLAALVAPLRAQTTITFDRTFHPGWFWANYTYKWKVSVDPSRPLGVDRFCITIPGGTGNIDSVGSPPGWTGATNAATGEICWTINVIGGGIAPGSTLGGFTAETICNPPVVIGTSAFRLFWSGGNTTVGFLQTGTGTTTFAFAPSASGSPKNCRVSTPPFPSGGQANTGTALSHTGFVQGSGPLETWAPGGSFQNITASTQGAGFAVFAGHPKTGALILPGGSVDIDPAQPLICIVDTLQSGLQCALPASWSSAAIPYQAPYGGMGNLASLQTIAVDPSSPSGISLSARLDLCVQDVQGLGPPETPPIVNASVAPWPTPIDLPGSCSGPNQAGPILGATTGIFPFPRDAICPNIGPVGTEHSLLGTNFDATLPGATQATLNGIPLTITLVRPYEIRFRTTFQHRSGIAGRVVVTSTGGVDLKSEDQMETWVFITPGPESTIPVELPGTGFGGGGNPGISGVLSSAGGLQARIGSKDGNFQSDYWRAEGIPSARPMRALLAQLDPEGLQVVTQASGLPPSPPPLNYQVSQQPFSQMWYAGALNCRNDTLLHHAVGNGTGQPGPNSVNVLASQDDGGPGTNSFFGKTGPTATQPSVDPDGLLSATTLDWFIADDFGNSYANPAAVVPYRYILITHW